MSVEALTSNIKRLLHLIIWVKPKVDFNIVNIKSLKGYCFHLQPNKTNHIIWTDFIQPNFTTEIP